MLIMLLVVALCMWIPSILAATNPWPTVSTLLLCLLNGVGIIMLCQHMNISKMLDVFCAVNYIVPVSAVPYLHDRWSIQLMIMVLEAVVYVLANIREYQTEQATEEAFLSTLLILIASYWMPSLVLLMAVVLAYLIYRRQLTGHVLMALTIAVALVLIYAAPLIYFGWISFTWQTFWRADTLLYWTAPALLTLPLVLNTIFYSGNTLWRGVLYFSYMGLCILTRLVFYFIG